MNPLYPQSLHVELLDAITRRDLSRDPDGFLPDLHAYQPDPVGLWLVQRSGRMSDRLQAIWAAVVSRRQPKSVAEDAAAPPVELIQWPRT